MAVAHAEQLRAAAGADLDQLATKDELEKAVTRLEGIRRCLVCQNPIGHRRQGARTCGNACRNALSRILDGR